MPGIATTYSFLDLSGAIVHPSYGAYQFTGEGVGEITISMATERTHHDIAADGTIMISKIAGNNGTIAVKCQQTSVIHKYLVGLYNYLLTTDTNQWAQAAMLLRNASDGTSHVLTGISINKLGDKTYKAQGDTITWTLMAADITTMNA